MSRGIEGFKRCSKCREYKDPTHFHTNRSSSDGLQNYCKVCSNEAVREHQARKRKGKKPWR